MRNATYISRVGALAVALGVGIAVANTPAVAHAETAEPDLTALIMGGGTVPTPDAYLVELIKNQYIAPTHPSQDIDYVAVTTPAEAWPITGLFRLIATAIGPREVWGPGGAGWWPDEPLWKLSGLFDLTLDQAVRAGVADLEEVMAAHGNDNLVIYGLSYGSIVAIAEMRKLAEQYPAGTTAPDIDFVVQATFNLPNGGVFARFPDLYVPIIDWSFNGPAPTDTQFDTVMINRQYDLWADFPLYPLNLIADLNAFLGGFTEHLYSWDVSLPADPRKSPAYQGTHGKTDYYFFETPDLPLFAPLRILGVPEPVIDVFEPFFRVIVELGYDRSIPPWEPTPARLIPTLDPGKVATDLVNAIGEGINNAAALIGAPAPLSIPAPAATEPDQDAAIEQVLSGPGTLKTISRDVSDDVAQVLTAVGSQLPAPSAVTHDDFGASQRKVGRELPATRDKINETVGAVKSVIGDGRTTVRSVGSDKGSNAATASPARKTPVRDAVKQASSDIKKVVTKVSDSMKTALRGGKGDDDHGDGGEGAAG